MADIDEDGKKEIGESCKFIFKKRGLKIRGARKRQKSTSEEGLLCTKHSHRVFHPPFLFTEAQNSGDEAASSSVVRPTKRKSKSNPNVQCSKRLMKRDQKGDGEGDSSSGEEVVLVSYKSKRSAMPDGPQDQGATAILVSRVRV